MIYYFVGLKRSGQHALIEWIANHFEGPIPLTNNCITWPLKKWRISHVFHVDDPGEVWRLRRREGYEGPVTECESRIITMEDPGRKKKFEDLYIGTEDDVHVCCIRSFWNNVASRMKQKPNVSASYVYELPEWWAELANAWVYRNEHNWVFINYDRWCEDYRYNSYRDRLRTELRLPSQITGEADRLSEQTANKGYAGRMGSSFFGRKDRGDVMARWRIMYDESQEFRDLVASKDCHVEECRTLNKELFGWTLDYEGKLV